jgi:hypothetical protein
VKKFKFYVSLLWKPIIAGSVLIFFALVLLLANQSGVPGGYTTTETLYFEQVKNGEIIPDSPLYLPVYLLHKIVLSVFDSGITSLRVVNALIGLISVVLMYFLVRRWQTARVAFMTCIVYLSLTWFLVVSRYALPGTSVLLSIAIPLLIVWIQNTKKQKLALLVTAMSVGLLLYVPGLIWIILVGVLWKFKSILYFMKNSPIWNVVLAIVVFCTVLIPFAMSLTSRYFLESISGVFISDISAGVFLENIYTFFVNMFWNSNFNDGINIGSQAVLDIFTTVLLLAGAITIIRKWKSSKYRYILLSFGLSIVLVGVGNTIPSIVSLPYIILMISVGLSWLMQQWFAVFPRNPFARNIGVVIVLVAVLVSSVYNVYRFYIAWPSMPQTQNTYKIRY